MIKMLFSIFSSSSGVTAAPSLKRRASRTLDSLKDPSASLSFCMVADNQSAESSSKRYTTNLFLQGAKDTHRQSRVINGLEKCQRRQIDITEVHHKFSESVLAARLPADNSLDLSEEVVVSELF